MSQSTTADLPNLARVARRKVSEWCLGKRARAVAEFIIAQSFERGRDGVRMMNKHLCDALGRDKGCISDAIAELIAAGVLQVIGRSGTARLFRFLPNAEYIEPESRVDERLAAEALVEIERMNADGRDVETTGQRILPIQTAEERLADDLAQGSAERALEGQTMREKMIESLRSTGVWTEAEIARLREADRASESDLPGDRAVFAGNAVGTPPTGFPEKQRTRLAICQPVSPPQQGPKDAHTYTRASAPGVLRSTNEATASYYEEYGAVAPEGNSANANRLRTPRAACVDDDLMRRVVEVVGEKNRRYWAKVIANDGQPGAVALHEALGDYKLRGGAPKGIDPSRWLFGFYKVLRPKRLSQ